MKRLSVILFVIIQVFIISAIHVRADHYDALPDDEIISDYKYNNWELFETYAERLFLRNDSELSLLEDRRSILSQDNQKLYDILADKASEIAAGTISDTTISITLKSFLEKTELTAQELGLTFIYDAIKEEFNPELQNALNSYTRQKINASEILNCLWRDMPYEFYWFDFVGGCGYSVSSPEGSIIYNDKQDSINIGSVLLTFRFKVSTSFSINGKEGTFITDVSKITAASEAAANAAGVVKNASGLKDHEKILYYSRVICSLVSYDKKASPVTSSSNLVWELINVFDNDPDTNVVCEGYAKAFKYLCDISDFSDNSIECHIVTGRMSENTALSHMWNIVHMEDGSNYIVDLTNCDKDNPGFPDLIVLKGAIKTGNNKYSAVIPKRKKNSTYFDEDIIEYTYDDDTLSMFDSELVISDTDYDLSDSEADDLIIIDEEISDHVSIELTIGSTAVIKPVLTDPEINPDKLIWNSNSDSVSVKENGVISAEKAGEALITGRTEDGKHVFNVSVYCRFSDVSNNGGNVFRYIYWAVENGIVNGYSDGTFLPEKICTREQFSIMLWRHAKEPDADASAVNRFTDADDFSKGARKAVAWAVEQGIVAGFADGSFRPNDDITRAQVAVMLWRFAGKPEVTGSSKFSDIGSFSTNVQNAIIWLEANRIASGYNDGTFKPDDGCQRQHMAIFLYRYENNIR